MKTFWCLVAAIFIFSVKSAVAQQKAATEKPATGAPARVPRAAGTKTLAASSSDPVSVVDREVAAYNARNIDAFLSFYSPDAELFEFPDKLLAKGKDAIRKRYEQRFEEPNLHGTIVSRMVIGDKVIDHEHIVRTFPEGTGTFDAVAINEVKGGLITRAWFIVGGKKLDKPQ